MNSLNSVGGYLAQTFETRDLHAGAALGDGPLTLLVGVAVEGLLLVADAEQRRLEDVEVARADHVGEELQEERGKQQADVHAVHIGVGGDDDLVVTQVLHVLLDVERRLQEVELLVLVDHLLREPVAVERLAAQREDGLRAHVARGLVIEPEAESPSVMKIIDCSASSLRVGEVNLAVAQLAGC